MTKHRLDSDMIRWFRQRGAAAKPAILSSRGGDGRTARSKGTAWRAALLGAILGLGATALATEGARPAAAAIVIQSCPFTAMTPGTYVLIRDLTCPAPAITVTANDVSLVLGGHTLTALTPGTGNGVRATGVTGLRIASGTVVGFGNGIRLNSTPGARIATVTASGNSGNGIIVRDSPGARLDGSTATGNGNFGIVLSGCNGCRLVSSRTDSNGGGIVVSTATGAQLNGNSATNNRDRPGILLLSERADGNFVRGNLVTGNIVGIRGDAGSTGNLFRGNIATGNSEVDLADLSLSDCVNTWLGNAFVTDNEGNGAGAGCIR